MLAEFFKEGVEGTKLVEDEYPNLPGERTMLCGHSPTAARV
jgi:hypothetical protein